MNNQDELNDLTSYEATDEERELLYDEWAFKSNKVGQSASALKLVYGELYQLYKEASDRKILIENLPLFEAEVRELCSMVQELSMQREKSNGRSKCHNKHTISVIKTEEF